MFDSIGWGEIIVLVVAGLFILGPERLPSAAAWLARTIGQAKVHLDGLTTQVRVELGPEFDDLRQPMTELRDLAARGPRHIALDALLSEPAPAPNPAHGRTGERAG